MKIDKLTPILIVDAIEPALAFWTALGFEEKTRVLGPRRRRKRHRLRGDKIKNAAADPGGDRVSRRSALPSGAAGVPVTW